MARMVSLAITTSTLRMTASTSRPVRLLRASDLGAAYEDAWSDTGVPGPGSSPLDGDAGTAGVGGVEVVGLDDLP
jgi:hypothetical protein